MKNILFLLLVLDKALLGFLLIVKIEKDIVLTHPPQQSLSLGLQPPALPSPVGQASPSE